MRPHEVLWFEDVSPFNEPVFSFPFVGRLSMRQLAILGIGFMISYALFQSTGDVLSIIPGLVTAFFALKKQHVLPTESLLFSVLMFYIRGGSTALETKKKPQLKKVPRIQKEKKKFVNSTVLKIPKPFQPKLTDKEIKVRKLFVSDFTKPYRMKIRLEKTTGQAIANEMCKVKFDGNIVSTLSTDANGELEVIIIPGSAGEKKLQVFSKDSASPIFEEILEIESQ
ncbi:MAG: hypothetical protein WAO91_01655 [Candidatus Nitrosotenuis sp.]